MSVLEEGFWEFCYSRCGPWPTEKHQHHCKSCQKSRILGPTPDLQNQSSSTDCSRLLRLWNSPDKNTGMGCHFLFQDILWTQGSNLDLLHCKQILYHLSHTCILFWFKKNLIWEALLGRSARFYIWEDSVCSHCALISQAHSCIFEQIF